MKHSDMFTVIIFLNELINEIYLNGFIVMINYVFHIHLKLLSFKFQYIKNHSTQI
jgi:hypothetical protein